MPHTNPRFISRLTRNTLALILAGGRGSRLKQLTAWRSKPAVPFGGKFRIIDFPLSNCINSGIRRIGVLTQYKAHSLILHIQKGWGFLRGEFGEFVELWPAQQRVAETSWYAGTADAVFQNLDIIRDHDPEYILILAGDHIYKMDYGAMIAHHVESGADMTVGCLEVEVERAREFGVMSVDNDGRVRRFAEKPANPETDAGRSTGIAVWPPWEFICSTRKFLYEQLYQATLTRPGSSARFWQGHVIPNRSSSSYRVMAYPFRDPRQRASNLTGATSARIDAFWEANIELVGITPAAQSVRRQVADLDLSGTAAAGQVRVRRR
jgi:glucose-1-phosphate adenylyltransferase